MTTNRKRETVIVWIITLAFLAALLTALFLRHTPSFIGICVGYAVILGILTVIYRRLIPASQRHRDTCPWDGAMIKSKTRFSSAAALIPELQVTDSKEGHQLWLAKLQQKHGVWTLEIEEREDKILAYSLTYRDSRTAVFDCGESIVNGNARFFTAAI